jgi:CheY-like chemotaxis protein
MSALPFRQEKPEANRIRILKLFNVPFALDPYHDRLISQGYEVANVSSYQEALDYAHEYQPSLFIVYDDSDSGIDALEWLRLQHTDRHGWMATTPLIILADALRVDMLKHEELPDRVIVLQRRADTLNHLTRIVNQLLRGGLQG